LFTFGEPLNITHGQLSNGVRLFAGDDPSLRALLSNWQFFQFASASFHGDAASLPEKRSEIHVQGVSYLVRRLYPEANGSFAVLFDNGERHEAANVDIAALREAAGAPDAGQSSTSYPFAGSQTFIIHTPQMFLREYTTNDTVFETQSFDAPSSMFIFELAEMANMLGPDNQYGSGYDPTRVVLQITPLYSVLPYGLRRHQADELQVASGPVVRSRAAELAGRIEDGEYDLKEVTFQVPIGSTSSGSEHVIFIPVIIPMSELVNVPTWPSNLPQKRHFEEFISGSDEISYAIFGYPIFVKGNGPLTRLLMNTSEVRDYLSNSESNGIMTKSRFWGWLLLGARAVLRAAANAVLPVIGGALVDAGFNALSFATGVEISEKTVRSYNSTMRWGGGDSATPWEELSNIYTREALTAAYDVENTEAMKDLYYQRLQLLLGSDSITAPEHIVSCPSLVYIMDTRQNFLYAQSGHLFLNDEIQPQFTARTEAMENLSISLDVMFSTIDPSYGTMCPVTRQSVDAAQHAEKKESIYLPVSRAAANQMKDLICYQVPVFGIYYPDEVPEASAMQFFVNRGVNAQGEFMLCDAVSYASFPLFDENGQDTGETVNLRELETIPLVSVMMQHMISSAGIVCADVRDEYTNTGAVDVTKFYSEMAIGSSARYVGNPNVCFCGEAAYYQTANVYDYDGTMCRFISKTECYTGSGPNPFQLRQIVLDPVEWAIGDFAVLFSGFLTVHLCGIFGTPPFMKQRDPDEPSSSAASSSYLTGLSGIKPISPLERAVLKMSRAKKHKTKKPKSISNAKPKVKTVPIKTKPTQHQVSKASTHQTKKSPAKSKSKVSKDKGKSRASKKRQ